MWPTLGSGIAPIPRDTRADGDYYVDRPGARRRASRSCLAHRTPLMRVALNGWFWNSPDTGSGQYIRHLVPALQRVGSDAAADLQVLLIVPSRGSTTEGRGGLDLPESVVVHQVPGTGSNLGKVRFEQLAFPRACARLKADLAHVPYWAPPARSAIPVVVTIHDIIPLVLQAYRGGPLQRLYTALVSSTAHGAALVLTDSEASRDDILTHLSLAEERVRAIPLAAARQFTPKAAPSDTAVRDRYGLPRNYMLYLGGFDRRKNLATAIATYRWAGPVIGDDCPLVVAGRLPAQDTAFTPDPRRIRQEQGIAEELVRFCGFGEEEHKPAIYRGATAFVFPSRYEGFGLPPLEALSCGTPVVGSSAASLPEIVGEAGILLPPDDARNMAGILIQLALDEPFRAELSGRAVDQSATFSWERTASATLAAYQDAQVNGVSRDA